MRCFIDIIFKCLFRPNLKHIYLIPRFLTAFLVEDDSDITYDLMTALKSRDCIVKYKRVR